MEITLNRSRLQEVHEVLRQLADRRRCAQAFPSCRLAHPAPASPECRRRGRFRLRPIAVELDGAQHLADPEAYRRDRRKDFLLQENGYIVLRFLAEDVGTHLNEILDAILRTLANRRGYIELAVVNCHNTGHVRLSPAESRYRRLTGTHLRLLHT
jgi:hypothetical protein